MRPSCATAAGRSQPAGSGCVGTQYSVGAVDSEDGGDPELTGQPLRLDDPIDHDDLVDTAQLLENLGSLDERNERPRTPGVHRPVIGQNADDQLVALLLGPLQHVEMPYVEQVENPGQISDALRHLVLPH